MKQQKIYSIIIGLVAYIIISHIFHVFFRGKTDIALSLLYIYNDMLYIVGFRNDVTSCKSILFWEKIGFT